MKIEPLPVVCLAVGDSYDDLYIARLHAMLSRHAPPFRLLCYSDRERRIPPGVELRDCSAWAKLDRPGMRVTTRKLCFFDPETVPFEEFLYLDLTLVIRQNMAPMLEQAFARPEALVIVRDWFYPSYNSCVMRIRRGPLQAVYEAFARGETFPHRIPGDQDFLHACVAARGLQERVGLFPEGQVVSYKFARKLNSANAPAARRLMEAATIVKFHGSPKPHQVLHPLHVAFKIRGRRAAGFWRRELRQHWNSLD